jgi:hypothetical protein
MERRIEWCRLQRSLGGFTSVTGDAIRRFGGMFVVLICIVRDRKQRCRLSRQDAGSELISRLNLDRTT